MFRLGVYETKLDTTGARVLLIYRRLPEGEVSDTALARNKADDEGATADDLNGFRRRVCVSIYIYIYIYLSLSLSLSSIPHG